MGELNRSKEKVRALKKPYFIWIVGRVKLALNPTITLPKLRNPLMKLMILQGLAGYNSLSQIKEPGVYKDYVYI